MAYNNVLLKCFSALLEKKFRSLATRKGMAPSRQLPVTLYEINLQLFYITKHVKSQQTHYYTFNAENFSFFAIQIDL